MHHINFRCPKHALRVEYADKPFEIWYSRIGPLHILKQGPLSVYPALHRQKGENKRPPPSSFDLEVTFDSHVSKMLGRLRFDPEVILLHVRKGTICPSYFIMSSPIDHPISFRVCLGMQKRHCFCLARSFRHCNLDDIVVSWSPLYLEADLADLAGRKGEVQNDAFSMSVDYTNVLGTGN
jgi:hypothetical protein